MADGKGQSVTGLRRTDVTRMAKDTKLAAYAARRDFQKTAEPKGDDPVRVSDVLRFVVQRHDATRLHYDLRLELDGVFKSWAVTKGPSLNPADKRLAVEVEDHPLGYGDFEGTIPKGEYGGGTVQLFDRGAWAPENGDPAKALTGGELKFTLAGERLKGSFVLVRLKHDRAGGKRTNWLLIKHRDADANDEEDGGGILTIDRSVASGRAMKTIAAGKGKAPTPFMLGKGKAPAADAIWDSSKGHAEKEREKSGRRTPTARTADLSPKQKLAAAPKARKAPKRAAAKDKTMPDFVAPQLCDSVAKPPASGQWLHEIKFDGYRMQLRVEGRRAELRTRTGLDWSDKFPEIVKAARGLPDAILDGEVVALDAEGRPDFSALQAALAAGKTAPLVYFAFDLLFQDGADLRSRPLADRKAALEALLAAKRAGKTLIRYVEHFDAKGTELFASARDMGLEGIVSKRINAPYRSGRTDSWTKAKCRAGHEVVLGGWSDTNGKFRSLLGGVFRDGKLAYVGRIGTGFSQTTIERLMPKLKAQARKTSPFAGRLAPPQAKSAHWLEPVLVAEIEFAGWSADGSVRQAAFKGLREDKPATEVAADAPALTSASAPPAQSAATMSGAAQRAAGPRKAGKGKVVVMGVTLSHPDKALWPDAGDDTPVTKRDLAEYLEAVGAWMLPHLEGRICSIIRAPDGIAGQTFFQRHAMAGGSDLFDKVKVLGDHEPYLVINRVEALAAVAQMGGLELHPANSVPGDPMEPGRLVFDLDPAPDVAFTDVVVAAKTLRERLKACGLEGFCKTTGGKGLHVVTPILAKDIDWETAKRFARDLCIAIERDAPSRFLTKASKAARTSRIYLDYLRNDRIATAVAVLSPRARPHAPVSMPLVWSQVRSDLDPARYTMRSVPALLKRSKAWAGYADAGRPLADAIAALKR